MRIGYELFPEAKDTEIVLTSFELHEHPKTLFLPKERVRQYPCLFYDRLLIGGNLRFR